MKITSPAMRGIIDRRILVNFRVQPDVISSLLPDYFRPRLINDCAIAGICLIRLKNIRPRGLPGWWGVASENAAHRIAVEWDTDCGVNEGVFIPRRDTSSMLQMFAGGRFFPGIHHLAKFKVNEANGQFGLQMRSCDGTISLGVSARLTPKIPATSIFSSLETASEFFAHGSVGYSAAKNPDCCDGLELHTDQWHVEALEVQSVTSSYFEDTDRFPKGTVQFDCALLMRNVEHEWRVLPLMERP